MCDAWDIALKNSYVCVVEEGDVFVINTRLWWHRTEIPGVNTVEVDGDNHASGILCDNVSISYARDIYLDGTQPPTDDKGKMHMSSKDGAWATAFLSKGMVLLTEVDPPITRTTVRADANCKLIVLGVDDDDDDDSFSYDNDDGFSYDNDDYGNDDYDSDDFSNDDYDESKGEKRGQMALVTTRDINEGEFFTILESEKKHGREEDTDSYGSS